MAALTVDTCLSLVMMTLAAVSRMRSDSTAATVPPETARYVHARRLMASIQTTA